MLEVTGRRHQARVFARHRPGGQLGHMQKKKMNKAPCLLAILLARAVHWYDTARSAQWKGSRMSLAAATGRVLWPIVAFQTKFAIFFTFFHRRPAEMGLKVTSRRYDTSIKWEGVK